MAYLYSRTSTFTRADDLCPLGQVRSVSEACLIAVFTSSKASADIG
jgi:hypothetical protein